MRTVTGYLLACLLGVITGAGIVATFASDAFIEKDAEINVLEREVLGLERVKKDLIGQVVRRELDDETCRDAVLLSREMKNCCDWSELTSFQEYIETLLSIKSEKTWWERKAAKAEAKAKED